MKYIVNSVTELRTVYMYAYVIKLLGIALLILGFSGEAAAQTTVWRDSLQVRIDTSAANKPKIENGNLIFTIQVYRPNSDWNNAQNDTILGDADLYFNFNPDAFKGKGEPRFISKHAAIDEVDGASSNALWGKARYWADRMQLAFRMKNKELATGFVNLPLKKWVTLGQVEWPCDPVYAKLGVVWDKPATGLMTISGNPIIDTLLGNIIKNPEDALQILLDTIYPNPVCAGETVEFISTASSSGTGLKYIWEYSKDNQATWTQIAEVKEGENSAAGFPGVTLYRVKGGDTLQLDGVSNKLDGYWFRCTAEDQTLTIPTNKLITKHQLNVRDSIWGFISRDADQLRVAGKKDTVTQCSNTNAMMRFNFYGIDESERSEIDSIYYTYIYWNTSGQPTMVTDTFGVTAMNKVTIGGKTIFYAAKEAMGTGQYMLQDIKTKYCNNASIATQYDTLYIKEGDFTALPRLTVKVAESKVIDSDFSAWGGAIPLAVTAVPGKGTATIAGTQVKYTAPAAPCTDTVFYTITGKECQLTREINVINNQYLSLKVLLEGPYVGKDKNGVDSMRCIKPNIFPTDFRGLVSPYNNNFTVAALPKLEKGTVCDWILIQIVEPGTRTVVDSVSAFLRQDGVVCDTAGKPYLQFQKLEKNVYDVIIRHRNHLAIKSANSLIFQVVAPTDGAIVNSGDFTKLENVSDKGENKTFTPLKELSTGIFGLYTGDVVKEKWPSIISAPDKNAVERQKKSSCMGYCVGDVDFNSIVTAADVNRILNNLKKGVYEKF